MSATGSSPSAYPPDPPGIQPIRTPCLRLSGWHTLRWPLPSQLQNRSQPHHVNEPTYALEAFLVVVGACPSNGSGAIWRTGGARSEPPSSRLSCPTGSGVACRLRWRECFCTRCPGSGANDCTSPRSARRQAFRPHVGSHRRSGWHRASDTILPAGGQGKGISMGVRRSDASRRAYMSFVYVFLSVVDEIRDLV